MSEQLTLSGMVLSVMPIGENDKRVVLLTREEGRISAFARGARRPGSSLMAACNPFVFGEFTIAQGRNSNSLIQASVRHYFTELAALQPAVWYGYYFLEFAGYYAVEGVDGTAMLNLLYTALRALMNPKLDDHLIRRTFELRLITLNGEFAPDTVQLSGGALAAVEHIMSAPLGRLFSYTVTDEIREELDRVVTRTIRRCVDREMKSEAVLEAML